MDWHLTLLSYISKHVDCLAAGGEEEYLKTGPSLFLMPFQFTKEIHKTLKNLDQIYLQSDALSAAKGVIPTLADFLIINEVLSLAPIGHRIDKYPQVVEYIGKAVGSFPAFIKVNKVLEKECSESNVPYFAPSAKL